MPIKLKHYLTELFAWCVLPLAFILAYLNKTASSAIVIFQHFTFIFLLILFVQSTNFLTRLIFKNQPLARLIVSAIYSVVMFSLVFYYLLVLIGLNTWHHVITIDLIYSYVFQLSALLETIEISLPLVIMCLIALFSIIYLVIGQFVKKHDWFTNITTIKPALIHLLALSASLFFGYWAMQYITTGNQNSKEPIKLTMLTGTGGHNDNANQGLPVNQLLAASEVNAINNYKPNPQAKKRNLVIFVVDALRPDHTNLYGYSRSTTPNLNRLLTQQKSVLLPQMKSTCSETTCAHAALLASRTVQNIVPDLFTLQSVLLKHDYKTRFIISGDHLNFYNIKDVYGKVTDYFDGGLQKKYYINDDRLILDKTNALPNWDKQPVMLHYHVLSAHNLGKRLPKFNRYMPAKNYSGGIKNKPQTKFTNYYDNGVLQADSVIAEILTSLKSKGYLNNTLVLITADHGESLGEHNLFLHTNSVYEQPLHIPMMFIEFGYNSTLTKPFTKIASLIDVAPSILNDFDMPIPATWQGQTMQDFKQRDLTHFMMRPLVGFYDHTDEKNLWKYWFNEESGDDFAYNLTNDPNETENKISSAPRPLKDKWHAYKTQHLNHIAKHRQKN